MISKRNTATDAGTGRGRWGWRVVLGGAFAFGLAALTPLQAQAASMESVGYGAFANEGLYPEQTSCSGRFTQPNVPGGATKTAVYGGRTITLKYFYSSGCGSFARIENAPQGCAAHSNRLTATQIEWVLETVDPGIDFAYTKVINNLDGRLSKAVLFCDNQRLAETAWY
ncbi:hypothetical protein ACKI1I_14870 [Streptomyces turgidiscabies]|uniref:Uncharacterized protein n=1 Tax=Streptomyces turgidiscabies (strain Car8) TaxID=698760 RepID=L7F796_STRT8|nr:MULTISPECIES: hypothetical protein [Streptomyces]ELP66979.1 hypothetical protein STRTUCAR8_06319 [Streptomyces turgidiscabies Car8]MDX3493161.1 hypothetical protein [Streptomyces turgidiscabies]GAQ70458.1 hypothetical protein T45_02193 [Streptomyces turgidiscabies]